MIGSPQTLILGHRGSPTVALENTLRSFALALEAGADGVELDVQSSHDRVPVVVHDETLDRTMGVAGRLADLRWPTIERVTGARLPSLAQVVAWSAASGAWLNVEMKARGLEAEVLRLLSEARVERAIVSSFDPEIVLDLGRHTASVRRFLLTSGWDANAVLAASESRADGVCLGLEAATDVNLWDLGGRGLPVIVWTVNTPAEVRRLIEAGVFGIITDDPAMAVAERRRSGDP